MNRKSNWKRGTEGIDELLDGDSIEIDNGIYQHWALYAGDDEIIHLMGPNKANAMVCRDMFTDYIKNARWRINNSLDEKYNPYSTDEIISRAESKLGKGGYNVMYWNCECFVNWCRYGYRVSRQVIRAAVSASIVMAGSLVPELGVVSIGGSLVGASISHVLKND